MLIGPSLQIDPEQATPMKMGAAKLLGSIVPWLPLGHLDMKDLSRDLEAVKKQGPNSSVITITNSKCSFIHFRYFFHDYDFTVELGLRRRTS